MHPLEQIFFDQVSQNEIDSDFLLEFSGWLKAKGDLRGEIIALEVAFKDCASDESEGKLEQLKSLKQAAIHQLEQAITFPEYVNPGFDFTWQYGFVT